MAKIYFDNDVDMKILNDYRIGIIGYGNQGRAQALNMRDSGFEPMIANRDDEYKDKASQDGFEVYPINQVAQEVDVILVLIPDERPPFFIGRTFRSGFALPAIVTFVSSIFNRAVLCESHMPSNTDHF